MGGPNAGSGGGSPNQMSKDKAKKDSEKAQRDAKKTANVEMGLGKDRMSNYSTSEGGTRDTGSGNDGNNTIAQVTATAPTTAEVSQATTTEAVADTEANRLLKIKKKGRSQSIMSGSQGVTKTSADYSLGKSSLLGKV
jgi:hypothetical protein